MPDAEGSTTNPHAERAEVLLELRRYADAEKEVRLALAIEPNSSALHACLAACLLEREANFEAVAAVRAAIAADPESAYAHYTAARVANRLGWENRSLDAIHEALRLSPTDADYHYLLAAIHFDRGRWLDALEAADRGLVQQPQHVPCGNIRGLCMAQLGKPIEARKAVDQALSEDPEYYWTHENRGSLALRDGDYVRALVHFREALRLSPSSAQARLGAVEAALLRNPIYRGASWLFGTRKHDGRDAWILRMLAVSLMPALVATIVYAARSERKNLLAAVVAVPILSSLAYMAMHAVVTMLYQTCSRPFWLVWLSLEDQGSRLLTPAERRWSRGLLACTACGGLLFAAAALGRSESLAAAAIVCLAAVLPLHVVLQSEGLCGRRLALVVGLTALASAAAGVLYSVGMVESKHFLNVVTGLVFLGYGVALLKLLHGIVRPAQGEPPDWRS